jgi:hypothetical protein
MQQYLIPIDGITPDDDGLVITADSADDAARRWWYKNIAAHPGFPLPAKIRVQPLKPADMAEWFAGFIITQLDDYNDHWDEDAADEGWVCDYDELFFDDSSPEAVAAFRADLSALYAKHAQMFQHPAVADGDPVMVDAAGWTKEAQE